MARRRRLRSASLHPLGRPPARPPDRRLLRGDVGLQHHGRQRRRARRGARPQPCDLAPVHPVARRDRDHRPRAGGPAAPARRRPAAARARDAGTGDRDAEHAHPRHRPPRLGALHRPHRRALRDPAHLRGDRDRRPDVALPVVRTRPDDDPDRRLLDQSRLDRELRGGDAVGAGRLHDPRRLQLRAHVPDARAAPARGARARRRGPVVRRAARARLADRRHRDLDRGRARRRRRLPCRRLHSRLDDDDDRLLRRRLQHLADARADDDRRADVRRRLGRVDDRIGQGRPASAARQDPPARDRPDACIRRSSSPCG